MIEQKWGFIPKSIEKPRYLREVGSHLHHGDGRKPTSWRTRGLIRIQTAYHRGADRPHLNQDTCQCASSVGPWGHRPSCGVVFYAQSIELAQQLVLANVARVRFNPCGRMYLLSGNFAGIRTLGCSGSYLLKLQLNKADLSLLHTPEGVSQRLPKDDYGGKECCRPCNRSYERSYCRDQLCRIFHFSPVWRAITPVCYQVNFTSRLALLNIGKERRETFPRSMVGGLGLNRSCVRGWSIAPAVATCTPS